MNLRDAALRLQAAITRAVREHGAPNSFGLAELHELYGGPPPMLAGRAVARVCPTWQELAGVSFVQSRVIVAPPKPSTVPAPVASLVDELRAPCESCEQTAYVTAGERLRGRWTCYGCGLSNVWLG